MEFFYIVGLTEFNPDETLNLHTGFWGLFWPQRDVTVNHFKADLTLTIIFKVFLTNGKKYLWLSLSNMYVISWHTKVDHCLIFFIVYNNVKFFGVKKDPKSWMCVYFFDPVGRLKVLSLVQTDRCIALTVTSLTQQNLAIKKLMVEWFLFNYPGKSQMTFL